MQGYLEIRILYNSEFHKMSEFQITPYAVHYRFANMFLLHCCCLCLCDVHVVMVLPTHMLSVSAHPYESLGATA